MRDLYFVPQSTSNPLRPAILTTTAAAVHASMRLGPVFNASLSHASPTLCSLHSSTAFPEHGVLVDEGGVAGNMASDYLWLIDPIDGTVNFAHGTSTREYVYR